MEWDRHARFKEVKKRLLEDGTDIFKRYEIEEALNMSVDLHTMSEDTKFVEKIMARGEVIYEV